MSAVYGAQNDDSWWNASYISATAVPTSAGNWSPRCAVASSAAANSGDRFAEAAALSTSGLGTASRVLSGTVPRAEATGPAADSTRDTCEMSMPLFSSLESRGGR